MVFDVDALLLKMLRAEVLELVRLLPVDARRIDEFNSGFDVEMLLLVRDVDSDLEFEADDNDSMLGSISTQSSVTSRLKEMGGWPGLKEIKLRT